MGYYFELAIIIIVICYQIYHSIKVYQNIIELKGIFDEKLKVKTGYIDKSEVKNNEITIENIALFNDNEDSDKVTSFSNSNIIKISFTDTLGLGIISRIKFAINTYLLNNYGAAVNFSIIKDIIDREVEVKDEEITQSIPTPLYLGLAATMIGIIFGLIAMPEIDGNQFSIGINSLINGVKLAMTASLTGLLTTTLLSSFFYKNAKSKTLYQS